MFFICLTVGLVFLASKYGDNVVRGVKNLCQNLISTPIQPAEDINENQEINSKEINQLKLDKIILADSLEKSDYAVHHIRCNLEEGVLGFDCEWVNDGPVALLQLATYNGVCALFRIGKIGFVPPKLKELLSNNCILKVGVATFDDGRKLTKDYGCRVFGTLDLRTFADYHSLPNHKSLAALSIHYLGIKLEKLLEIRCGDWNADQLSEQQISYAAGDALSSALIYRGMQTQLHQRQSAWQQLVIFIKLSYRKKSKCNYFTHNVPQEMIDTKYRELSSLKNNNNDVLLESKNITKKNGPESTRCPVLNPKLSGVITRKEPLYQNCYLQAPDGETLCTCDRKKAEWYVQKGLAELVMDDPFTVKLHFEPSGRAHGEVGQYYTQVKLNQCVVCGSGDKFIKKNVVPREYRKCFPVVMKSHQSHDVLLLCPSCHEVSNRHDLVLRRELAKKCGAPLTRQSSPKADELQVKRRYLTAVKVLQENTNRLPQCRRQELELHIQEYDGNECATIVPTYYTESELSSVKQGPTHGEKVVDYFTKSEGGLVNLERIWRQHFLDKMKPRYLPPLWSVNHNQDRLKIRQTENRIEPEDAKVAGIVRY